MSKYEKLFAPHKWDVIVRVLKAPSSITGKSISSRSTKSNRTSKTGTEYDLRYKDCCYFKLFIGNMKKIIFDMKHLGTTGLDFIKNRHLPDKKNKFKNFSIFFSDVYNIQRFHYLKNLNFKPYKKYSSRLLTK